MSHTEDFLTETAQIARRLDTAQIESLVQHCIKVRQQGGRIFFLGVGGNAANASHAVNDFRKIAGIECYAPTDNVAELTARINDEGWDSVFVNWLIGSRLSPNDAIFVLSVGGGDERKKVSANLVGALKYAKSIGCTILGITGRDGGYTVTVADSCVVIPIVNPGVITAHTEAFQSVIWHLIISHPDIKAHEMKWESMPSEK